MSESPKMNNPTDMMNGDTQLRKAAKQCSSSGERITPISSESVHPGHSISRLKSSRLEPVQNLSSSPPNEPDHQAHQRAALRSEVAMAQAPTVLRRRCDSGAFGLLAVPAQDQSKYIRSGERSAKTAIGAAG
eukprot:1193328-Prorocentrum_minimum.AAC.2